MEAIKNILNRIKWKNVAAVLFLIALLIAVIWLFPSGYKVKNNIGLKASLDPDKINIGERSRINVEVKNMYSQNDAQVIISALTYDDNLVFMETGNKTYNSSVINVGPSETRQINFNVESKKNTLAGSYRIDVKVLDKGNSDYAEDTLFLNVEKS